MHTTSTRTCTRALQSVAQRSCTHTMLSRRACTPNLSIVSFAAIKRNKSTTTTSSRRPFAFAFDIDGVLLKSSKPIPGAVEALTLLKEHDIPFILLTNGGGLPESQRTKNLSNHLGLEISTSQFIQSHTPFQVHAKERGYRNVLVCGGDLDVCRRVATGYGFPHVTIPFDILSTDPAIWPFHTLSDAEKAITKPISKDPIDAIYVFHDPRDWGLDSQVIIDVLLSDAGKVGTRVPHPSDIEAQAVPIYFSNPDLLWANAHPHARFGQGAFQILVEGLYGAVTEGKRLSSTTIGKPSRETYAYANAVLSTWQNRQSEVQSGRRRSDVEVEGEGTVYMVGDNKLSDIQGANEFGWESVLVRTGVFQGTEDQGLSGTVPAKYCVQDVKAAVDMVLKKEGVV